MTVEITVKHWATDMKKGMTLAEVELFCRNARESGAKPDALVRVATGFRSQIQILQVPR